ncbi:MAG: hypothetical protein Q7T04_07455 [Dehalococcoidia bacterium]|nr:hypothetical protein [Dehalococcoidia bacterium]
MKDSKGITAAISAAVAAYLEEEQAAQGAAAPAQAVPALNLWGSFGRQEIMRMRMLWQLRIVPLGRGK